MHATCPHCHHDLPATNALPSRFHIGEPVWIYHGAARRQGVVVGVTFRAAAVDYLVHTNAGVEHVPSLDVSPYHPPAVVQGNVVAPAAWSAPCT
jgi:hypothetical protein